jgi:hypothetical protein
VQIAAGIRNVIALRDDGTVTVWGDNTYGQADVPTAVSNVVRVGAGANHCTALLADGRVMSWGITNADRYLDWGQSHAPTNITNAVSIAVGGDHNLALLRDGAIAGWGSDDYGQVWDPSHAHGAVAVAAGHTTSFALLTNGTVLSFGRLDKGRTPPVGLSNVVAIGSRVFDQIALRADGSVVTWGVYGGSIQASIGDVVAVDIGGFYRRALLADNSTAKWFVGDSNVTFDAQSFSNIAMVAQGGGLDSGFTAILTGDTPYQPLNRCTGISHSGSIVTLAVETRKGLLYRLESTESLTEPFWTLSLPTPGSGGNISLTATNGTPPTQFYRIRGQ